MTLQQNSTEEIAMITDTEIVLDVANTDDIPEDLYEYLLDQFVAKAKSQGIDLVERNDICISDWVIKARIEPV
jgi:type III secretion system FlhB-like substrate exporter